MNNRYLIFLSVCISLALMCSCDEKVKLSEEIDITGFWEGEYNIHGRSDIDPQYMNLLVKKDGTITNEAQWFNGVRINLGTWELNGNAFKYQVSNVVGGENPNPLMGTAILDPSGKLIDGIWQNLSGSNSGTFELIKRQ